MVVVLQRHHEGDEGVDWDLKGFQEVSLLAEWGERGENRSHINHKLQFFSPVALIQMNREAAINWPNLVGHSLRCTAEADELHGDFYII